MTENTKNNLRKENAPTTPVALTVLQLRDKLDEMIRLYRCEDAPVAIRVFNPGAVGPTPKVNIDGVHAGFDWDSGVVFLSAMLGNTEALKIVSQEEQRDIARQMNERLRERLAQHKAAKKKSSET